MRRILIAGLLMLGLLAPASATQMLQVVVTTAVTAQLSPVLQIRPGPGGQFLPTSMGLQATVTYGSGGTTIVAWIQTSLDGGTTWNDVCTFNFTTASLRNVMNIVSATQALAPVTLTDGALAGPNVCLSGLFGTIWRVKYTTTGTYAGNTTLRIDAVTSGLTPP